MHRVQFDCLVQFEADGFEHICELLDISLKGALICACSGATPEAGTPCTLKISLNDSNDQTITMRGYIAHKNENRVGIFCEEIDVDSITHLRKVVELNLGDSGLLQRDLKALYSG